MTTQERMAAAAKQFLARSIGTKAGIHQARIREQAAKFKSSHFVAPVPSGALTRG